MMNQCLWSSLAGGCVAYVVRSGLSPIGVGLCIAMAVCMSGCDVEETKPTGAGVELPGDGEDDDRESEGDAAAGDDEERESGTDSDAGGPARDPDAGGADLDADVVPDSEAGAGERREPGEPSPSRGFVVVSSDYASSTVGVLRTDGSVLSPSLISSGSEAPGLSLALGSDIVFGTSAVTGDEIVIIDRDNTVLHWVNLETAEVERQLNVGPGGFAANPYDYVPYTDTRAFVTRHASNGDPGQAEFDEGGDVVIVDPSAASIVGRISLSSVLGPEDAGLEPRPDSALIVDGVLYVLLVVIDADFLTYGEPRVVSIDPEQGTIQSVLGLGALRNCGDLRVSPDQLQLVVGCIGDWGTGPIDSAGIALIDVAGAKPELVKSFRAEDLTGEQIGSVEFADDDLVLFVTTGQYDEAFNPVSGDELHFLRPSSNELSEEPLLGTASPFSLGELRCAQARKRCLLADAETDAGVVHLLEIEAGEVTGRDTVEIDDGIGHPPRYVGLF